MPHRKQQSLFVAGLSIAVLLVASFLLLRLIHTEEKQGISENLQTTLKSTLRLVQLHEADYLSRVQSIVDNPALQEIVLPLFESDKMPTSSQAQRLDDWISPIYRTRGFTGYNLIRNDTSIIASTTPFFIGRKLIAPESRQALERTLRDGAGMSRPTLANFPIRTLTQTVDTGVIYQLVCARVTSRKGKILGALCLRIDPFVGLFELMKANTFAASGESYLIDRNGRMLSPSRFESEFSAPEQAEGWSNLRTWARVPPGKAGTKGRPPVFTPLDAQQKSPPPQAPLTKIAQLLIQLGAVNYLEEYEDYRGKKVIGAGFWFKNMDMGIIVEQDMEEAYRSYEFTRYVIIAMTSCAVALIVILTLYQQRSRRALATSEANLRAFMDNVPAAIHIKDVDGRYLMTNANFEHALNIPNGTSMGKTDRDILPAVAKNRELQHQEVIRTQKVVSIIDKPISRDGEQKTYRVLRFPILKPEGKEVNAVGTVAIDITDQTRTQAQLEILTQGLEQQVSDRTRELTAARDEAEHAMQVKSEFLANMSHEIRTPLNAIVGMSHLATRLNTDPRVQRYLDRIQTSNQHLLNIVNDILDFSKIEAGKMPVEQNSFSLERMLEHVSGMVWEQADAKGLEFIVHIDSDIPDQLIGDPLRISQILVNFSNNAIKFTEHGEVILRVRLLEKHVLSCKLCFEVEDSGIGIPAERIPELFQPFQQVDSSLNRRFGGTGLGLVISKKLADLMHGQIQVRSVEHQGSVFSLELSLERARVGPEISAGPPALNEQYALVIDDNAQARHSIVGQLESLSLKAEQTDSGQNAIDLIADRDAADQPFHLVFIDWKMPGMSGLETAAQIRMLSLKHAQPKLVLMAPVHMHHSAMTQVDGVVAKPVSPSQLFDSMIHLSEQKYDTRTPSTESLDRNWHNLNGRHLLLVEDNEINQEVARDLLEIVGIQVTIANDGMEAIQLINMQAFDLVLMDIHMPVMNGFEATQAIRRDPRFVQLPIIAMTANAMEGDRERCLQGGMNDYIPKPINPEHMFETISRNLIQAELPKPVAAPAQQQLDAKDLHFYTMLQQQPGLNTELGLKHVLGRVDLYTKLVRRVLLERNDTLAGTLAAIEQENFEAAIRYVHGFKAISGSIGAEQLQHCCVRLETELRAHQTNPDTLGEFTYEFSRLMAALSAAYSGVEEDGAEPA